MKSGRVFLIAWVCLQGVVCFAERVRYVVWQPNAHFPKLLLPVPRGYSAQEMAKRYLEMFNHEKEFQPLMEALIELQPAEGGDIKRFVGDKQKLVIPTTSFSQMVPSFTQQSFEKRDGPALLMIANQVSDMIPGGRRRENYQGGLVREGADVYVLPLAVEMVLDREKDKMLFRETLPMQVAAKLGLGGDDIAPDLAKTDPKQTGSHNRLRDEYEMDIYRAFLVQNQSMTIDICRAMEMTSLLFQHRLGSGIPAYDGGNIHKDGKHVIQITAPWSFAHSVWGKVADVESNHDHWVVPREGSPYVPVAYAPDGIIEGMETGDGLIVGLQHHPENDRRFLKAVVRRTRENERDCLDGVRRLSLAE